MHDILWKTNALNSTKNCKRPNIAEKIKRNVTVKYEHTQYTAEGV